MIYSDKVALLDKTATIQTKIEILPIIGETEPTIITENDSIISWEYEDFRYVPNNGFVGQFVSRTLNGQLKNISDTFNIENREIILWLGIKTYNDITHTYNTNYYSLGNFLITEPEDNEVSDITNFESMDYAKKFNKTYVDNMTYPCTPVQLAQEVCLQCGTTLGEDLQMYAHLIPADTTLTAGNYNMVVNDVTYNFVTPSDMVSTEIEPCGVYFNIRTKELGLIYFVDSDYVYNIIGYTIGTAVGTNLEVEYVHGFDFPNSDFNITSNQFVNGETCRDVIKAIAMLSYTWAKIGWDNKLYFEQPMSIIPTHIINPLSEIDNSKYYDLTTQKVKYGPVNRVTIGYSNIVGETTSVSDNTSIGLNGLTEIFISDNPLTYNQTLRESAITEGSALLGLEYYPIKTTTIGHPWLNNNDIVKIVDMEDTEKYMLPLDITISFNGHIKTTLESYALTKTETQYLYTDTLDQKIRNTQVIVDKQAQTITQIVETTDSLTSQVTQVVTDVSGINVSISDINNTVGEQQQDILTLQTSVTGIDLQISKTGGNNIFNNPVAYFFDGHQTADDWTGIAKAYTDTEIKNSTVSGNSFLLQNSTLEQIVQVPNGTYTVSFLYKKLINLSECSVVVNGTTITLTGDTWKTDNLTFEVTANTIDIQVISDTDDSCYFSDLMGSIGTLIQVWSNNPNEAVNGGVKIGKGIEITSSTSNIMQKMDNDGNRIINTNTDEVVSEFTDKGLDTKEIISDKGQIGKLLIVDMGSQTWLSRM